MKKLAIAIVAVAVAAGGWAFLRGSQQEGGAGIGGSTAGASGPTNVVSGPPVSVSTVAVQKRDVDVMLEATGTVTALNSVDVRPQIATTITKVHIKEGQFVRVGE